MIYIRVSDGDICEENIFSDTCTLLLSLASAVTQTGSQSRSFRRRCPDSIRGGRFRIFVDEVVIGKVLLRIRRQPFIIYL